MRKRCADEKQLVQLKFGLPDCQPQALFALCTGASSDPTLKVYTAKNVTEELERAKREFLQAGVVYRRKRSHKHAYTHPYERTHAYPTLMSTFEKLSRHIILRFYEVIVGIS
ncbi:unnamed protein product [Triticum turgidum subsp. durum]|uniref:DUF547 domain-containing protein n=1 Tax=Triticum turgidum subsp. durum TaxID=4567 RepID=A0A9R0REQ0_TRITD|nr:unnamed protein product [Triticum turgidum subsp. durum]